MSLETKRDWSGFQRLDQSKDHSMLPSLILSTLLSLLWATLWFAWRGGGWQDWLIDALVALLGFGIGQMLGVALGLPVPGIGGVRVVEGTLCAWVALWIAQRLRRRPAK